MIRSELDNLAQRLLDLGVSQQGTTVGALHRSLDFPKLRNGILQVLRTLLGETREGECLGMVLDTEDLDAG
jgi:hypothetical protein